jgi:hypothetical protein
MTYKVAVLSLSLALLLFVAAYLTVPAATIAVRSVNLLGAQETVQLAEHGRGAVLRALYAAELLVAVPWLVLGGALAIGLRLALGFWQREPTTLESVKVIDEAGVEFEMLGESFEHVPALSRMALAPLAVDALPTDATELQRQAFAAIAAVPSIPADTQGKHACSLFEHTRRVYGKAAERYGARSLEADLAALHDVGKLLCYANRAGSWVQTYPYHDNLALVVAARLPAFWRLPPEERARLSSALTVLCTRQTPSDLDPELRQAINACRALDRGATQIEKSLAQANAPEAEADFSVLCAAIRSLPEDLGNWNVNGVLRTAAAAEGWWLPDEAALLLPATRIRAWLASRLAPQLAEQLNLAHASTASHAADAPIADALRNEGLLAEVVQSQKLQQGWWRSVIAREAGVIVAALRGDRLPSSMTARWGKPRKEILLEPL